MIDDLDKTLRNLLAQALPSLGAELISFDAPDAQFAPAGLAVNFFLYDVRENRELRSSEWLDERQPNGNIARRRPAVRVACAYLITAWAGDVASEHRLLGQVMRALLRYPKIPAELLAGELAGQRPDPPTTALQASNLQSLGEFWQAMGGKPRAALSYTVTIGVDVAAPEDLGPPVKDRIITIVEQARQT
jgi:hypothetical protein